MGRLRENRLEGIEDGADLFGKLCVIAFEPPPRDSGLASLLTPRGTESFPELFLGESCARSIG
jgi:hypothetical protein